MLTKPLDVRETLAKGIDPYDMIMKAASGISHMGYLSVDAPFNPSPLRRVLAGHGFSSYGRKLSLDHWRIFFHRDGAANWEQCAEAEVSPEGALIWREQDEIHMDVRKLPPPAPLVAIVRMIDSIEENLSVVVHHDREPRLLAPELAERGWQIVRVVHETANIRLWLERVS